MTQETGRMTAFRFDEMSGERIAAWFAHSSLRCAGDGATDYVISQFLSALQGEA